MSKRLTRQTAKWHKFTFEELQEYATQSTGFERNISYLPNPPDIEVRKQRTTLLATSLPFRMHVGYVYIVFGPCSGQKRCVFAYMNCTSTPTEAGIHYCTSDDTIISQGSILNIELTYPFNAIGISQSDDEQLAKRLRVLVLYYFLAKGHIESIRISEAQLSSFKIVCANVAKLEEDDSEEPSDEPDSTEVRDRKHGMEEDDDERTDEKEEGFQHEEEGESNRPAKKQKDDEGFVEYQKLVQLVREQIESEYIDMQKEYTLLLVQLASSENREEDLENQNQSLKKQVSSLQLTQARIDGRCKQAEKEVQEQICQQPI